MADLNTNFAGIKSPNQFWLVFAPTTNMVSMVCSANGEEMEQHFGLDSKYLC
jgi:hypothetical protein